MPIRTLLAISVPWVGLAMVADGLSALLLPYLVLLTVNSASQASVLGLITIAGLALAMAAQPLAGAVSDGAGTRRPLILGGTVATLVGMMALGFGPTAGLAVLVIGYVIAVIGANIVQAGQQALIPDVAPPGWRGRAAGLKGLMDVGGAFVAFALLATLLADGRVRAALIILGGCMVLATAVGLPFAGRVSTHRDAPRRRPLRTSVLWDGISQRPDFVRLLVSRFLFLLGVYAVGRFLVLFMAARLGLDADAAAAQAGIVLAVLAGLTAVASAPAGWLTDRLGRVPLMVAGGIMASASIGLLPLAGDTAQIAWLGIPLALGTAAFGAGSWAMVTDLVPPGDVARSMGLANYATVGAAAFAGLLGPLVDAGERATPGSGYTLLMVLASVSVLVGGLLALRLQSTADGHRRHPIASVLVKD